MEAMDFRTWLVDSMRAECKKWANDIAWLEVERNLFADTIIRAIKHIINGGALLLATDERREWFGSYALSRFYYGGTQRPLMPIFSLNRMLDQDFRLQKSNMEHLINMLDIAYGDYMFWYVGQPESKLADLCISKEYGLFWVLGGGIKGAFSLNPSDEFLDYKLIEMLKLFEAAIYESMLNRIIVE